MWIDITVSLCLSCIRANDFFSSSSLFTHGIMVFVTRKINKAEGDFTFYN